MTMHSARVVVAGGGTAGLTMAKRIARVLGKHNVALIEPNDVHYYQPMWTLIGAGLKDFHNSYKQMSDLVPKGMHWEKQKVTQFQPDDNCVVLDNGDKIEYEYLIVALGLELQYWKVPGLVEGMEQSANVCSNYHSEYVKKTFNAIENFKSGMAIFTHPNTPIKCAGASQKILYLAEDRLRQRGDRDNVELAFATANPSIFGVEKYAKSLQKIVDERNIKTFFKHNLMRLDHERNVAIFNCTQDAEHPREVELEYSMIHVTPPMGAPKVIRENDQLAAKDTGYLDIDISTLQHNKYRNIFGIGDNINIGATKTAAAIASQTGVLEANLRKMIGNEKPTKVYDGYTSCPLVTGKGKGMLAEFDKNGVPLETFPLIRQDKERWYWYHMKATMMPILYWHGFINGPWRGPGFYRKLLRLGLS